MLKYLTIAECCKKVLVSSSGKAGDIQWDRMGIYSITGRVITWIFGLLICIIQFHITQVMIQDKA